MTLSIIIPTLNEEDYIEKLLNCLSAQTFKNFEVIVVDGNSEDKTCDIVNNYTKIKKLRLIKTNRRSVSIQRNLGVEYAKSEYLMFLDADGYIEPNFLSQIITYVKNHDVDIMTTWLKPLSDKKIDKLIFYTYNQFYLDVFKKIRPTGAGAFIFIKKNVFDSLNGFDDKQYVGEDQDLYIRAFKRGYKYHLLKDPCIKTSIRRLDKQGRLKYVLTVGKGAIYSNFIGPIDKKNILDYEMGMGGKYYKTKNKKKNKHIKKIKREIKKIKSKISTFTAINKNVK